MTPQEFFELLDARIAKYDLLCHPFYKAWAAGKLSHEDLRKYGLEYYRHVAAFPSYLEEFAARVPDKPLRRAVIANRDEENGADSSPPHAELWLDFVEGMGGERDGGQHPRYTVPEIAELTNWFHAIAQEGTAEQALAAFYAYESQVPRVAAAKGRGLRERYGADEKTCGYFTLHTTADVNHSRVWRHQLAKLVDNNFTAAKRALEAGENAAEALWKALDGIEAARLARAA
jgi:pyrroloquinoline-quinone synthase